MKAVTVHLGESLYRDYQRYAKSRGRTASELIREALDRYWEEQIRRQTSLEDLTPHSVGRVLRPIGVEDDVLAEMLESDD